MRMGKGDEAGFNRMFKLVVIADTANLYPSIRFQYLHDLPG